MHCLLQFYSQKLHKIRILNSLGVVTLLVLFLHFTVLWITIKSLILCYQNFRVSYGSHYSYKKKKKKKKKTSPIIAMCIPKVDVGEVKMVILPSSHPVKSKQDQITEKAETGLHFFCSSTNFWSN